MILFEGHPCDLSCLSPWAKRDPWLFHSKSCPFCLSMFHSQRIAA